MKFVEAIKAFFGWIRRMLEDGDGVPSSKRVQSWFLILFGCVLALTGYEWNIVGVCFGAGLGLQGVTAFQR